METGYVAAKITATEKSVNIFLPTFQYFWVYFSPNKSIFRDGLNNNI